MKMRALYFKVPLLPGCVTTAKSRCGKPNCACKASPPTLHGPYFRWSGMMNGKLVSKTISKEVAKECERRIKNYKKFLKEIETILEYSKKNAPWET